MLRYAGLVMALALVSTALVPGAAAWAQSARILARFTPEAGSIADAAVINSDEVALLYPEDGRISVYNLGGELQQHIWRESGAEQRFRPTACAATPEGDLLVFDEAAHQLFRIAPDGNFTKGVNLAYPTGEGSELVALSRVGGLELAGATIWALLTDRAVLAGFDAGGKYIASVNLAAELPYAGAVYARAQLLGDGSLFVMDYSQGAVLYRRGPEGGFRRLRLEAPAGIEAAPLLMDFAVDEQGNVMMVTSDPQAPVRLLTPDATAYKARAINIRLPDTAQRLACRCSRGKYIVWTRENPLVIVLEVRE